uniref:Uncharacterized protein n=1 Tax=Tetradesmus obliquus TaxID=3088 RepID=A0A383WFJ4_TETOB|eukprot:jgi/Sobl393_1/9253/SZX75819.1
MLSLAAASRLGACTLSRGVFNASFTALRAAGGSVDAVREYATGDLTDGKPKTILAVLYKAGENGKRQPKLLGCVENELGLRSWLESRGHTFIVTDDKGPGGVADKHLPDADIVISTPFHPYYLTADRLASAKK